MFLASVVIFNVKRKSERNIEILSLNIMVYRESVLFNYFDQNYI